MSLAQGRVYNALLVGGGSQVRVNKSNNLDTLALEIGSMNRLILFIGVSSTNIVHHLSKCNFSFFSIFFFIVRTTVHLMCSILILSHLMLLVFIISIVASAAISY